MTSATTRVREAGVTWRPSHDAHYMTAALLVSAREAPPICVLQPVLLAVDAHLRDTEDGLAYGMLTGRHCHCPRSGRAYLLVDVAHPLPPLAADRDLHAHMATALGEKGTELQRAGCTLLGYYRGAATVEPRPAPADVALLHALFPEPWQLMLVREDGTPTSGGAFVRFEPIGARAYPAPFMELLPRRRARRDGRALSTVAWRDYHPDEPVLPLAPAEGRRVRPTAAEPRRSLGARLHGLAAGLLGGQRGDGRISPAETAPPSPSTASPRIELPMPARPADPPPPPVREPPTEPHTEPPAEPVAPAPAVAAAIAPHVAPPTAHDPAAAARTAFAVVMTPDADDDVAPGAGRRWPAVAAAVVIALVVLLVATTLR